MFYHKVNIFEYPTEVVVLGDNQLVVHGDGHGSLLNTLYYLILIGLITFPKSSYERLVTLYRALPDYQTSTASSQRASQKKRQAIQSELRMLLEIDTLISEISLTEKPFPVVHVGDLVGDRGKNCILIFLLLHQLAVLGYRSGIITQSNHDAFTQYYLEFRKVVQDAMLKSQSKNSVHQGQSLLNLDRILSMSEFDQFNPQRVHDIYREVYLPQLQLFHCVQHGNTITLITHAPVGLEVIDQIAFSLGVSAARSRRSANDFFDYCQRIQNAFVRRVEAEGIGFTLEDNPRSPYYMIRWNRPEINNPMRSTQHIPGLSFDLFCIHGHTFNSVFRESLSVDSRVGKLCIDAYSSGFMPVCILPYDRMILRYDPEYENYSEPLRDKGARTDVSVLSRHRRYTSAASSVPQSSGGPRSVWSRIKNWFGCVKARDRKDLNPISESSAGSVEMDEIIDLNLVHVIENPVMNSRDPRTSLGVESPAPLVPRLSQHRHTLSTGISDQADVVQSVGAPASDKTMLRPPLCI